MPAKKVFGFPDYAAFRDRSAVPAWAVVKVKKETPEYIFWSGSTTPEDAPSYFQKLYRKVFKAAGVEGSSHDFRHTFAIEQAETRRRYTNGEQGAGAFVSNSD